MSEIQFGWRNWFGRHYSKNKWRMEAKRDWCMAVTIVLKAKRDWCFGWRN